MNIQLTNIHNLPLSMVVFLADDNYDGRSTNPFQISVTTLLKSPRQIILGKRLPNNLVMDISDSIASRLGQAYHKAVEDAWLNKPQESLRKLRYPKRVIDNLMVNPSRAALEDNPNILPVYLEQRTDRKVGKWTISGQFDLIVLGVLEDIKTTSVYNYMNQTGAAKFRQQGSLYRWLNPELVTEDYMNITYIFTDWSSGRARTTKNYPPLKIQVQKLRLMEVNEVDLFVKNKLTTLDKFLDKPEKELPLCTDEDLWRGETVYKYYGKLENVRSSKTFTNRFEAESYVINKGKGRIEIVLGEAKACKYCPAFSICSQAQNMIATGEIKIK